MKIIKLEQGTDAWLSWRNTGLGASDCPAILGANPYMSPIELWALKTGKIAPKTKTSAMQRGNDLEPEAREAYVKLMGIEMEPVCGEHNTLDFMKASFDGINFDKNIGLEIKCPLKKANHELALQGEIPALYRYQVQHQLFVSGLRLIHYVSYSPQSASIAVVEVFRDEELINNLVEKCTEFWNKVQTNNWE